MSSTRTRTSDQGATLGSAMARVPGAFSTPAGLLAVLLIAVQAIWRGSAVSSGYFTQDDFVVMARAAEQPLDADYLTTLFAGEFAPLANLLAWLVASWAPMQWGSVTLLVIVLQTVAAALTWLVLTRLLSDRWVRIPLLAVALFTPLTLAHTMWYSLALLYLPALVLLLVAVLALLARLQDGWEPGFIVAALSIALALGASDHTLLFPLALFGVVAAAQDQAGGIVARLSATIRDAAPFWVVMVVLVAARLLLEASVADRTLQWPSNPGELTEQYVRQLATGLVGGPWEGEALKTVFLADKNWPIAVAVVLLLALAMPFFRSRHPAARVAALTLVLVVVLGGLLLMVARNETLPMAVVSRYVAVLVPMVVLLVAAALRHTIVPPEFRGVVVRLPGSVATLLAGAVVVSAGVTVNQFQPSLENADDRAYVENIADGLRGDPRIVLLDGRPPEDVLSSWFGGEARISTVTAQMPERPSFDLPSQVLRMVDGAGYVRAIELEDTVTSRGGPDGDCGYAVGLQPVTVRMETSTAAGPQVMSVGYFYGGESFAVVRAGGQEHRFPAREGVHRVEMPVAGGFDRIELFIEDAGAAFCVVDVTVGTPTPAPLPPAS